MTMNKYRLMDISFYYWLKDITDRLGIPKLVEGFLEVDFVKEDLPLVAFDNDAITLLDFELGSRRKRIRRSYVVHVFAKTKKQRDDMMYEILGETESPVEVYNYNEGFPPATVSKIGYLRLSSARATSFSYRDREDSTKRSYMGSLILTFEFDEHTT